MCKAKAVLLARSFLFVCLLVCGTSGVHLGEAFFRITEEREGAELEVRSAQKHTACLAGTALPFFPSSLFLPPSSGLFTVVKHSLASSCHGEQ